MYTSTKTGKFKTQICIKKQKKNLLTQFTV